MVHYECFRCGYNTKFKSSLINHLNRKNVCNPIYDDIGIEENKKYYGFEKIKTLEITPNSLQPHSSSPSSTPSKSLKSPHHLKINSSLQTTPNHSS